MDPARDQAQTGSSGDGGGRPGRLVAAAVAALAVVGAALYAWQRSVVQREEDAPRLLVVAHPLPRSGIPDSPAGRAERAAELNAQASQLIARGGCRQAVPLLEQAAAMRPSGAVAALLQWRLGYCMDTGGAREGALVHLRAFAHMRPDDARKAGLDERIAQLERELAAAEAEAGAESDGGAGGHDAGGAAVAAAAAPPAPAPERLPAPPLPLEELLPGASKEQVDMVSSLRRHAEEESARPHAALPFEGAASRELDPELVAARIRDNQKALEMCVSDALTREPGSKLGRMAVDLTIEADGTVRDVSFGSRELGSSTLGRCLRRVLRTTLLPSFDGPPVRVEVPLMLRDAETKQAK